MAGGCKAKTTNNALHASMISVLAEAKFQLLSKKEIPRKNVLSFIQSQKVLFENESNPSHYPYRLAVNQSVTPQFDGSCLTNQDVLFKPDWPAPLIICSSVQNEESGTTGVKTVGSWFDAVLNCAAGSMIHAFLLDGELAHLAKFARRRLSPGRLHVVWAGFSEFRQWATTHGAPFPECPEGSLYDW